MNLWFYMFYMELYIPSLFGFIRLFIGYGTKQLGLVWFTNKSVSDCGFVHPISVPISSFCGDGVASFEALALPRLTR